MCMCMLYGYMAIRLYGGCIWFVFIGWDEHLFLRPIYLVSMDQVSMGIYGPGTYGSGTCVYGPGIYGPGTSDYGPGTKVSRYLGI